MITELPGGKILISGGAPFQLSPPVGQRTAIRLMPDGSADSSFVATDKPNEVQGHAAGSDGSVILYGRFTAWGGHASPWVVRLNDNGTPDLTFKLAASWSSQAAASTVLPLRDGRLIVASTLGDLIRVLADGTVDSTFQANPALASSAFAIGLQTSGKLLVVQAGKVFRLNADGTRDTHYRDVSFTLASTEQSRFLVAPDDSCFVTANTQPFEGGALRTLVKLLPDGGADPTFQFAMDGPTVGSREIRGFALQPDGKLLVSGSGFPTQFLMRIQADGTLDEAFPWFTISSVFSADSAGRVLALGSYVQTTPTVLVKSGVLRLADDVVPSKPSITVQPVGSSAHVGGPAAFKVVAIGTAPLGLQWLHDEREIPGATNETYTIDRVTRADAGNYRVVATNSLGSQTSAVASLEVIAKPSFSSQPTSASVDAGKPVEFTVTVLGEEPITCQWELNGIPIPGATDRTYAIVAAKGIHAGSYQAVIRNGDGTETSLPAVLTVRSAPTILVPPVGFTLPSGVHTNLTTTVTGEEPLGFQWYKDGAPVTGATEATLDFPSLASRDAGRYLLVVTNGFGEATSPIATIHVLATLDDWLVVTNRTAPGSFTNETNPFRPDSAIRVVSDGLRGEVLLYGRGIERWNDAGERLWSIRYANADAGSLNTLAVDRDGNAYVGGMINFTALLGDLGITNNSSVTGPNGHVQAFIAKIDPDGHGLWYRLFEAAGPRIYGLAIDLDGGVVFAGAHGGKLGRSFLGTLFIAEEEYAAAVAGKLSPDGTPQWLQRYPQFTFNRSTCEADSVAVDESGIYLSGVMSASIQFGPHQLQNPGLPVNWIGRLATNNAPQWVRSTGSLGWQGAPLAARGGRLWMMQPREKIIQSWSPEGALLATIGGVGFAANDSAAFGQLGVTGDGEPIVLGHSVGPVSVGGTLLTQGANRPLIWFGQWDASGVLRRARVLATSTNASALGTSPFSIPVFTATPTGDVYLAGSYSSGLRFLGQNRNELGGAYLAKIHQPAVTPEITQAPIAAYTLDTGGEVQIGIQAAGPGPLTFQWRRDGVILPDATNSFLKITNAIMTDAGRYDVTVTNPFGSITSGSAVITVTPPFVIRSHPLDRLVILGGELSGNTIGPAALNANSLSDKLLSFIITNTSSARFPLDGHFTTQFSPGAYEMPATGVFGLHQGGWLNLSPVQDFADIQLRPWTFDNGRPTALLSLGLFGRFTFHIDTAAPDSCCASGTYTIQGGSDGATFQVATSSLVPDGNFQWQKDGVDLPGQTAATLKFPHVNAGDVGLYRCVITYRGYSETSRSAELKVGGSHVTPEAPNLHFTLPAPGASTLDFTWPTGHVLQRATSLAPPNWSDYATTPPVSIPMAKPGEFFRLMRSP